MAYIDREKATYVVINRRNTIAMSLMTLMVQRITGPTFLISKNHRRTLIIAMVDATANRENVEFEEFGISSQILIKL